MTHNILRPITDYLNGQTQFGRLTVIGNGEWKLNKNGSRLRQAKCICECGNTTNATCHQLREGLKQSCGCKVRRPNDYDESTTKSVEYQAWKSMKRRCHDKKADNYPYYGGRGIAVCEQWRKSFTQFYTYIGPKPNPSWSVDREDVNGNYEPGNVRWASPTQQSQNTRRTKLVMVNGIKMPLTDACKLKGISILSVYSATSDEKVSAELVFSEYLAGKRKVRKRKSA